MFEIPSRDDLDALKCAAGAIVPTGAIGFVISNGSDVSILYVYAHGVGGFALPIDGIPDALRSDAAGWAQTTRAELEAHRARAVEVFLLDNQVEQLVSMPLDPMDASARFWMALSSRDPLSADQRTRIEALADDAARVLSRKPLPDEQLHRLTRLERCAELIPALLHVLDVRGVIDRLSATAKSALPHDLLVLSLFGEALSTFTVYARSDRGAGLGIVLPNPYPAATIKAWTFSIIDDHTRHPMEQHSPATKIGARSSLRFPIRFDDRVIGGIAFVSFKESAFTEGDVPVGRRLSDHVASAISHFMLAERLADQARRTEELRAQATNLEMLDTLLAALTDADGIQGAFERISAIARKVLSHDALALPVFLPGGKQARRYAATGLGTTLEVIDLPEEFLDPTWEHDLIDDVTTRPGAHNARVASLGFMSALRVPIRLDGKNAAALIFLSKARSAFKERDVAVARRIADRLTVTLARDNTLEAHKRADEATERAARLEARVRALTEELDARTGYRRVIGESVPWRQVLTQATQVAATETTALLLGESGTGKEVIARFLHRASKRTGGPFVALNCAALPEQLLEAELFGYERGAFTGATQSKPGQLEQASGGTLFLDEVGEMSLPAQAKFLRVLQEREFQRLGGTRVLKTDARIVAATNRDLQLAIARNQFREDLFYRLNVFAIRLPALRDRRDDILPLTEAFLAEFGRAFANPPAGISREAKQMLLDHHWPGNIRELRNILERAAILCDGGLITGEHLALPAAARTDATAHANADVLSAQSIPGAETGGADSVGDLQSMERAMIERALANARFNKSKAAKELGLTRRQLYVRMRRHGFAV